MQRNQARRDWNSFAIDIWKHIYLVFYYMKQKDQKLVEIRI